MIELNEEFKVHLGKTPAQTTLPVESEDDDVIIIDD